MLLIVVLCMILTVLARPVAAWATSAPPTVIIECDNPVQKKTSPPWSQSWFSAMIQE